MYVHLIILIKILIEINSRQNVNSFQIYPKYGLRFIMLTYFINDDITAWVLFLIYDTFEETLARRLNVEYATNRL